MERRDFIKLGAGFGAALATQQSPAWSQTKMVLKAADVHPLGYPTVEAVVQEARNRHQWSADDPDVSVNAAWR
jgi:hypothetical protein